MAGVRGSLLLRWRDLEVEPDVDPVVRDRREHPHIIRAQKLRKTMNPIALAYGRLETNARIEAKLGLLDSNQGSYGYLDLELQELDVVNCFFKHRADVHLKKITSPRMIRAIQYRGGFCGVL
jgi:hypothetical protein